MDYSNQTHGYADPYMPASVSPVHATGYGMQDTVFKNFLGVPPYKRSTTADSACSLPSRAPSLKRPSCDHERELPDFVRTESKRVKKTIDGTRAERTDKAYFCTHPDCDRKFDRLCETKKHFKAKHTPLQLKPHGCTIDGCEFRGMWPKDIRRHLKQKHGVVEPAAIVLNTSVVPATNVSYEGALGTSPLEITPIEEEQLKASTMAMLAQTFSMLKRLRIRSNSKSSDDKFIMVTKDRKSFCEVNVTGLDTAESLIRRIKNTLDLHDFETEHALFYRWNRARDAGEHLNRQALVNLVSTNADAQGSLKLFLEPPQAVLPPAHMDPYSVVR